VRAAIVRAVVGGAFATALLALALVVGRAPADRLLRLYVLVLGALTLAVLARATRASGATRPRSAFELALRRRRPGARRVEPLERIEREVSLSLGNELFLHTRLRPLVMRIASDRLLDRHGIDLERSPERARAVLDPAVWELVRPDREAPQDVSGAAVPLRAVAAMVEGLERV
jgi:hypothetical protein